MSYQQEGVPLVVVGGKEYGSGSSRDWAAKGTSLLGVRVVIAESFERIHRSNLVGMGVLPLQFPPGESAESLGIDGSEPFDVEGFAEPLNAGELPQDVQGQSRARWSSRRRFASTRPRRPTTSATGASSSTSCDSCSPHERRRRRGRRRVPEERRPPRGGFTQTLRELLAARGPSGYETAPAAVWSAAAETFGAEVSTDVVGTPSARVARARGRGAMRPRGDARAREESPLHAARARGGV